MPIPTRFERWIRSNDSAITAVNQFKSHFRNHKWINSIGWFREKNDLWFPVSRVPWRPNRVTILIRTLYRWWRSDSSLAWRRVQQHRRCPSPRRWGWRVCAGRASTPICWSVECWRRYRAPSPRRCRAGLRKSWTRGEPIWKKGLGWVKDLMKSYGLMVVRYLLTRLYIFILKFKLYQFCSLFCADCNG